MMLQQRNREHDVTRNMQRKKVGDCVKPFTVEVKTDALRRDASQDALIL